MVLQRVADVFHPTVVHELWRQLLPVKSPAWSKCAVWNHNHKHHFVSFRRETAIPVLQSETHSSTQGHVCVLLLRGLESPLVVALGHRLEKKAKYFFPSAQECKIMFDVGTTTLLRLHPSAPSSQW